MAGYQGTSVSTESVVEQLDETECLRLIAAGGIGRIAYAEYQVAFEIDEINMAEREGWSVLVQGPAHHVDSGTERAAVRLAGVEPWPGGTKEHFVRVVPTRITGRRIRQEG